MCETIKEIWAYREMIRELVHRDLRGRYKGSVLGFLWTFINPFLQLMVYTMVFSIIMRSNVENYYLFLFVALIPWLFFSACVSGGCACVRDQQALVSKIYFPREVIPIAYTTSSFVNMLYCFVIVFVACFLSRVPFTFEALACLPLIMLVEYILGLGFTLLMSGLTVYFRDLQHIMSIVAMAWQFLTPVMYDIETVPENLHGIFYMNPMTSVIIAYREIMYYGRAPQLETLGLAIGMGIVFLLLGSFIFGRLKRGFAEQM